MALHKINEFDPDYRDYFDDQNVLSFDLYSGDEKVGSVEDILVDDAGQIRYLVVNTGVWIFGKKVLLPIGQARLSYSEQRVYATGLTREQVENLPEYDEQKVLDYGYEEQVRNVYRPTAAVSKGTAAVNVSPDQENLYDRDTYDYDQEADLYGVNEQSHSQLKLHEERLIANKARRKTGEVSVGKRVETETSRVSVPLEKEQIVIERVDATSTAAVAPGEAMFQEGEVARIDVYEEVPDVRKEVYVREQVNVRKEIEEETVTVEEQLRREELDVKSEGSPARPRDRDMPR
jgi:uncharacterized protein (TIGR02271 family)